MDPTQKQAAESLVVSLANGSIGDQVELTETQKALKIPKHLVYICGLVLGSTRFTSFTKDQTLFFQKLQKLYQDEIDNSEEEHHRIYQLSRTLVPRNDVHATIHADVRKRQAELAIQANDLAEKLMDEESKKKVKQQKKADRKKTARPSAFTDHQQVHAEQENKSPCDDNQETLEDLMRPVFTTLQDEDLSTDNWTKVTKKPTKKKQTDDQPELPEIAKPKEDEQSIENPEDSPGPLLVTAAKSSIDKELLVVSVEESLENEPFAQASLELAKDPSLAENSTVHADISSDEGNELCLLRDKVRQLELEILSKDEMLKEERAAHSRALS